jgi:catechol 2,3-dioxygenase-like lactoylglutathione lyase family enzyme
MRRSEVMPMLGSMDTTSMIAVRDVEAAKQFYRDTLGMKPDDLEQDGMARLTSGSIPVCLYESEFAGTNQANALAWSVGDDFDAVFEDLRSRGVTFEHYDLPGLTLDGDVHVADGFKGVWFKDPDGNILHVNGR